jgi:hypothetical protein
VVCLLTGCVVLSPVAVSCAEAVCGVAELGGGSGAFWLVGAWAWGLKGGGVVLASVQGVMWGAVHTIAVNLYKHKEDNYLSFLYNI